MNDNVNLELTTERDHYKQRCEYLEHTIKEWLAACETDKDGQFISYFARRAYRALTEKNVERK